MHTQMASNVWKIENEQPSRRNIVTIQNKVDRTSPNNKIIKRKQIEIVWRIVAHTISSRFKIVCIYTCVFVAFFDMICCCCCCCYFCKFSLRLKCWMEICRSGPIFYVIVAIVVSKDLTRLVQPENYISVVLVNAIPQGNNLLVEFHSFYLSV